jgi:hypothetical protein
MAVNLSLFAGAGWQFFDNSGNVLTGGKLITYAAGTTTPLTTYTSNSGLTPNTNPIILDASGRLSGSGEIWLSFAVNYKFVLTDSNDVLIGTYDNIAGGVTDASTLFYAPGVDSLLAPGPISVKSALDDLTDKNTGASVVGFKQNASTASSRTVQAKLYEYISVKDFGAVGDGVADDTIAIQTAINSVSLGGSIGLLFPEGTYLVTNTLTADQKYIGFYGQNVSASKILFKSTPGTVLFDLYSTVNNNKAFSFYNITISTDVALAGTAIKIQANLTGAPIQVNGQRDSLYLNNVRIVQEGSGYWTTGLHVLNMGGVHFEGLTIDNNISAAQSNPATTGVFLENNSTRVNMIRTFIGSDIYILRTYNSIKTTTPDVNRIIESIYINNGELVGIGNAAFKMLGGGVSAFAWNAIHVDTTSKAVDTEGAYFAVARFVGCDFRRGTNGGASVAGPFIIIDCGEGVKFVGCQLRGSNNTISNVNNYCFKFTNTGPLSAYTGRFISSSNVFVNFYRVYATTFNMSKGVSVGNSFNFIQDVVSEDSPEDTSIVEFDAIDTRSVVIALTGSGTFTVTVNTDVNYFADPYVIAFLQQASASGTDVLNLYYDSGASTSSQCVFRGSGNASYVGNVRFSFMAVPRIHQSTRV